MFKLVVGDYFWPVTIKLPIDGGKHEERTIELKFKRVPQSEYDKLVDDISEGKVKSAECAKKLVIDWKDVVDDEGNSIPFTEQNFNKFLEIPHSANTVFLEYNRSLTESKIKN